MKRFYKNILAAIVVALIASAADAATRVWSQTEGTWSTDPKDTPFTGRSFADGDSVIFNDPENLSIDEKLTANVSVHGTVLPSYITFNNDSTVYAVKPDGEDASIGLNEELGRVQIVTKNGSASVTIDTPLCYKNVIINEGTLTLNDMPGAANTVTLKPNTTFNFLYTGDIAQPLFSSYSIDPGATFHRLGTANFGDVFFPDTASLSTFQPGSRLLFDDLNVSGAMYLYNGVHVEALKSANINGLEVWSNGVFRMTGTMDESRTNTIETIDVLCGGSVQLREGYFRIGSLTTNDTVSSWVARGADDYGRLIVGGSPSNTNRTYFSYVSPPGIVYTQNEFIGNTEAEMPEVTIGGNPDVNSYMYVTNGANLKVHGRLVFGGGDARDRLRRLTIADNSKVSVDGYMDLTEVTNYLGKVDARILVTNNSVFSTAGIKYGPKDLSGDKTRQVKVMDGSTFELGADNDGDNIAGVNTGTDKKNWELGENYTGKPHSRSFIIDNSTLRFTQDQTFNQTIFLQEGRTNVLDLAGHVVTNCASINPYYAGDDTPVYSEGGWCCNRFEIQDTSPEQNGYLYLDVPHYSIRNGYTKNKPAGYVRKQYGTQLISGRLRINPEKGEDCGFSLRGGILDIPVGKDHKKFVHTTYDELCTACKALACIWDSEIGATIRCYCSSKDQLVRYSETNTWQLVCEVITRQDPKNNFYDGIPIDKFMRLTSFQLIDESTGEMLPGATFCAWPLQKMYPKSTYEKKPDENKGWWYENDTTTNRYAILMRYEDDLKKVTDLYWQGSTDVQTWSDYNEDDWFDPNGEVVRYGDGANVYITNLTDSVTINVDRSTELRVEQIVLGDDGKPSVDPATGMVVTNFYSSGYKGQKPVSVQTLNISNCMAGVTIDATNTLITTYGIYVTNSVATIEGYAVVDGPIQVVGKDSYLTITQLVHRSSWYVGPEATFHAGYADPEVWFSTMSHTITNYGTVVYNLCGETEHITQLLTYPEDVKINEDDGYLCHFEFVNGVMEFYGTDYLTRRANTNVWISTGCTRRITGTTGTSVAAATSYSPMGYKNGGKLLVDIPYRSNRGIVLMNQASVHLNEAFTLIPGSSISVIEHVNDASDPENIIDWSGEMFITGNDRGVINFEDNPAGSDVTFESTPFRFYTAAGETNHLNVAMTGAGNIVVEGGGTLILGKQPSTVSGTLTVKSGSILVVEGPESLGALDVTVEDGGTIIFQEKGRPQKACKSVTMDVGAKIGLGPSTSVIEPDNPVRILQVGVLTMPKTGVDAISLFDSSALTEAQTNAYKIVDVTSEAGIKTRRYTMARSFQSQYVELFGLLGELVWDTGMATGPWFSLPTIELQEPNTSYWHKAKSVNTLEGYNPNEPFANFMNSLSNSVTFISPAVVTVVTNTNGAGDIVPSVYPSGITFGAKVTEKNYSSPVTRVEGDSPIGSESSRVAVLATQGTTAALNAPVHIRNLTVDDESYLRVSNIHNEPTLTVVEEGSRLAVGGHIGQLRWDIDNVVGEGRLDKIGPHDINFNIDTRPVVPNHIGVGEGQLQVSGDRAIKACFRGGLTFERDYASLSEEGTILRLWNNAGVFGWVFDGTLSPFLIDVNENARLYGNTFGVAGLVNIDIADDKRLYVDTPLVEYEDMNGFIKVSGGTIRFSAYFGTAEEDRYDARLDISFATNTVAELNSTHLHAQNVLFNGKLVVMRTDGDDEAIKNLPSLMRDNNFDRVFKVVLSDYINGTEEQSELDSLVNFPMPVKVDVAGKGIDNPKEVVACMEDGTELPCEFDFVSGGMLLTWVSIPKVEMTNTVYIGVANETLNVKQKEATEVWNDYAAVWHMNVVTNMDGTRLTAIVQDSTTNAATAVYTNKNYNLSSAAFSLTADKFREWDLRDGHLGKAFRFNKRGENDNSNWNGFYLPPSETKKVMDAMSGKSITMEGFLSVSEETIAKNFEKVLCYRPGSAYHFTWQAAEAGLQSGIYVDYKNSDGDNTQLYDKFKMTTTLGYDAYFFAGTRLDDSAEKLWLNEETNSFQTYKSGTSVNDSDKVNNRTLYSPLFDSNATGAPAGMGIGYRPDASQVSQSFSGALDELRIRTKSSSDLWMNLVRETALHSQAHTQATDVTPGRRDAICATKSVRFGVDSTIEIYPDCVTNRALMVDLTNGNAANASLITPTEDASVNIDITRLGALTDEMNGWTLISFKGTKTVNIFAFQLVMDEKLNTDPSVWALRAVSTENGMDIQLVKAQGAVLVISPAKGAADADWPANDNPILSPSSREFAASGEDFAILSHNFNVGTNLHDGAIIRDTYVGATDGVTTHQITNEMITTYTPNTDYWFWFDGDNGAWSKKENYRLNIREDGKVSEDAVCYTQFAVTNQIFYGQATDTLNSGELGFYVNYNMDTGKTNLVGRILNTTSKVEIDIGNITDPWLIVTVTTVPYEGYRINCNGKEDELYTPFAERPEHLRITGVAAVDNLFISLGNPNRDKIVYVHDMTVVGTDANGNYIWADSPIDCTETYQKMIIDEAGKNAGFEYQKPTQDNPAVQMLPVAFHTRVRRTGVVRDSKEPKSGLMGATGSEHLNIIDLLALTPKVARETVKATSKKFENIEMDVYQYDYEYALGIHSVNRAVNNAVSIFSVLSDSAESYDEEHLLGTAENPHKLNGWLYIEATESPTPYKTNTVWKPVSVSSMPQFGDNHLNETFVAAPVINSNQTFRVRVNKTRPTVGK